MLRFWVFTFLLAMTTQSRAATLIFTNDVLGEIEPCGCRNNPAGGVARKAQFLNSIGKPGAELDFTAPFIQVDAGDFLFENPSLPLPLKEQSLLQASYLLKAHEKLGHHILVPGEKDFAWGLEAYRHLTAKTKIQILAANLKDKKGRTVFKPSTLLKLKGAPKVAFIGLLGPNLTWPADVKISDPILVAKQWVKAQPHSLTNKPDLLVAITHQGIEADIELAKQVPEINVIVGAHSQSFLQTPQVIGKTILVQSSYRNQYVGLLPLEAKLLESPEGPAKGYRLVQLGAEFDTQEMTEMKQLAANAKKAINAIESKNFSEMKHSSESKLATPEKYQTFPHCGGCHSKQFDFWRKTPHALALSGLKKENQLSNRSCLQCHSLGFAENAAHSKSNGYSEAQKIARILNVRPSPTPSGAAGDGKSSDSSSQSNDDTSAQELSQTKTELTENKTINSEELEPLLKQMHAAKDGNALIQLQANGESLPLLNAMQRITQSWAPVQCENCHQPGYGHPFTGSYSKTVETKACLKCHTEERAPEWYKNHTVNQEILATKFKLMKCPSSAADDPSADKSADGSRDGSTDKAGAATSLIGAP